MTETPIEPAALLCQQVDFRDRRVVDVGCGEGALSRQLLAAGASQVIGVECGAAMLVAARASEPLPGLEFVEGVGQALPLETATADFVVYSHSLHHVPPEHQHAALVDAQRVLIPGGQLLVLEPIARGPLQELLAPVHDETEVRAHAQATLERVIAEGRFERLARLEFVKRVEHPDFASFRDRIVRINPDKAATLTDYDWKTRFEALAQRDAAGWFFHQPVHFDRLRRS